MMDWDIRIAACAMTLITGLVLGGSFYGAFYVAPTSKQECLERGGYPFLSGPRSYRYNCFKENPLLPGVSHEQG